jgi:hypothetical protein
MFLTMIKIMNIEIMNDTFLKQVEDLAIGLNRYIYDTRLG